jgi:spoIIIJ-associated protein
MQSKKEIVEQLIKALGFTDYQLDFSESETEIIINLTLPQEDSGVIIGFRGEKISALQYLLSLMFNQDSIAYKPVNVDINGYHKKRQLELTTLADSAAEKAVSSGREILLPPMSASDRRLIHMHLSVSHDVDTYSEGEGVGRRIVVRPKHESA